VEQGFQPWSSCDIKEASMVARTLVITLLVLVTMVYPVMAVNDAPTKVSGSGKATASGVQYWDLKPGTGAAAESGKTVSIHYTGWLADGKKFDSSLDRGRPFSFRLGEGSVIKGWDEGVAGMKVGGKRQLKVPAASAYGDEGKGGVVPPSATLTFEIQLVDVK
jgi:FKBP-type peptidyl-prolyl cis-trans isomerase